MSEENDNIEESAQDEEALGPLAGERLAEARRAQQISLNDIAKELHLDEYKVRAMECNDFDVLGAPVFAKGHLRKYAQLVNVDQADVMADYYQLNRSAGAPPVIAARPKRRQVVALGPWIATIIVIIVVAAAYWWFASDKTSVEPPVTGQVAPLRQSADATIEQQAEELVDEATDDTSPEAADYSEPEPVVDLPVQTGVTDMRLSISYLGDCWTEITDANGRRLFFDLGKAGRTVNLSGEAPFNVLFGDAANVSIKVNGAAFDIPASDRRGRTARLTIRGS
jgi:cytoskeleton protein RodZ